MLSRLASYLMGGAAEEAEVEGETVPAPLGATPSLAEDEAVGSAQVPEEAAAGVTATAPRAELPKLRQTEVEGDDWILIDRYVEGNKGMEESWYVTPPACFTRPGPVHVETSPLENLLIEHPSMSVYAGAPSLNNSSTSSTVNNASSSLLSSDATLVDVDEDAPDMVDSAITTISTSTAIVAVVDEEKKKKKMQLVPRTDKNSSWTRIEQPRLPSTLETVAGARQKRQKPSQLRHAGKPLRIPGKVEEMQINEEPAAEKNSELQLQQPQQPQQQLVKVAEQPKRPYEGPSIARWLRLRSKNSVPPTTPWNVPMPACCASGICVGPTATGYGLHHQQQQQQQQLQRRDNHQQLANQENRQPRHQRRHHQHQQQTNANAAEQVQRPRPRTNNHMRDIRNTAADDSVREAQIRSAQQVLQKRSTQTAKRNRLDRANKVREVANGKSRRPRRQDRLRLNNSGANNNRKC